MPHAPGDKRFTDAAFQENPFYRIWLQTYLGWCDALERSVDDLGLDPRNAYRTRFALGQIADALAPTNTWLGNPAAIKKLVDTGGASAVRGFLNALEDLASNGGMPSQVDKTRFRVGENLALTPGAVVFRNDVLELIQYAPATDQVYHRPLLVVPPQINKFYLLDLAPGRSLLEYLVSQGVQTFVVSWRNPSPGQRDWGLDTYKKAILEATDAARSITHSDDINIAGACSGGITTAQLIGDLSSANDQRVSSCTLLVTALDGASDAQLGLLATPEILGAAKISSEQSGVLHGKDLGRAFAWLRPNDLVWNYWVNNYLMGDKPPAFDVLYWNNDTTNLPARLHHDFLDLMGSTPDLSHVTCDTYVLAGTTDHITPWKSCYASTRILGGKCDFVLSSSGHVQSVVNPPGNPKAKFSTNAHMASDADEWLASAEQHSGSWWEHWCAWLGERSGASKKAPARVGNPRFIALEPAPGSYVLEA